VLEVVSGLPGLTADLYEAFLKAVCLPVQGTLGALYLEGGSPTMSRTDTGFDTVLTCLAYGRWRIGRRSRAPDTVERSSWLRNR
jgi:hypothetical protein